MIFPRALAQPNLACGDLPGCGTDIPFETYVSGGIPVLINWFIFIIALAAFAYLVKGGFDFITSMGSEEKYKKALKSMIFAAVGLVLAMLSFLIVTLITSLTLPDFEDTSDTGATTAQFQLFPTAHAEEIAQVDVPNSLLPQPPRILDELSPSGISDAATRGNDITDNERVNLLDIGPNLVLNTLMGLFTSIATVIAIIGGSQILFSQGDQKKLQQGLFTLMYAAIGMIIIGASWVIITLILNFNL